MKKILYYLKTVSLIALLCFAIGSCSKDSAKPASPTDETKDRGMRCLIRCNLSSPI